jgi:ferrochelatase
MAYGTPRAVTDVAAFYTDVRRGRPPSPEQLADLERRYAAIGGLSPLNERTAAQLAVIQQGLEDLVPGGFDVVYGAKHAAPTIEEAVANLAAGGYRSLVGAVLAPHYSALSVGEYIGRAEKAAVAHAMSAAFVSSWGEDPLLIEMLAERVRAGMAGLAAHAPVVVFTAHSLPARLIGLGDGYIGELQRTADAVAERLSLGDYRIAWQSAGRTPEPWIGPDLLAVLAELAAAGREAVLVCPAGFTSDHLEVLYDLDIEAQRRAHELGIGFARTASLNDDPRLGALLARRIVTAASDAP